MYTTYLRKLTQVSILIFFLTLCLFPTRSFAQTGYNVIADPNAQEPSVEVDASFESVGRVLRWRESTQQNDSGTIVTVQTKDEILEAKLLDDYGLRQRFKLDVGQTVRIHITTYSDGTKNVVLVDIVRSHRLFWSAALFCLIAIAVGRKRGLYALVGVAVTFLVLFGYLFPRMIAGGDPIIHTIIASIIILAVNMHLSHGVNKHTFGAFVSTMIGLFLALVFSKLFVATSYLSGFGDEAASLLLFELPNINIQGILLSGMILGAVGVLDDIAINQSECVTELLQANQHIKKKELFAQAMRIGRHHIASVVNTLTLAYVGVALPLFLVFLILPEVTLFRFLNEELIAQEIIRTLAGTSALVLIVPISTWIAVWQATQDRDTV